VLVEGQSATGNDRMDVRMKLEISPPSVKHERGADCRRKVCAEIQKNPFGTPQQSCVDGAGREPRQAPQLCGKRENDVEVPDVEHAGSAFSNPLFLGQRLTLRAMPVATRVVRRMLVATRTAAIDVTTEGSGAALRDIG
jgi:hypothetical protein